MSRKKLCNKRIFSINAPVFSVKADKNRQKPTKIVEKIGPFSDKNVGKKSVFVSASAGRPRVVSGHGKCPVLHAAAAAILPGGPSFEQTEKAN